MTESKNVKLVDLYIRWTTTTTKIFAQKAAGNLTTNYLKTLAGSDNLPIFTMTKREIDIMNLAFYMSQAVDSLKNAEQLFTSVFPNGLAFVDLRIAEIKGYAEQANRAIRNELEAQDRAST